MSLIYFSPILIIIIFLLVWYFYDNKSQKKQIVKLSKLDTLAIVDQQKTIKEDSSEVQEKDLFFKLIQAGLTKKEYNEGKLVFSLIGLIIGIAAPILFNINIGMIGILVGVLLVIFGGPLYLYIAKSERIECFFRFN
jgi:tight adherence protein C